MFSFVRIADMTQTCSCVHRPENKNVGPYCDQWRGLPVPWCYLSGDLDGKYCKGAKKSARGNFYWTEDKGVCSRNKGISFSLFKFCKGAQVKTK